MFNEKARTLEDKLRATHKRICPEVDFELAIFPSIAEAKTYLQKAGPNQYFMWETENFDTMALTVVPFKPTPAMVAIVDRLEEELADMDLLDAAASHECGHMKDLDLLSASAALKTKYNDLFREKAEKFEQFKMRDYWTGAGDFIMNLFIETSAYQHAIDAGYARQILHSFEKYLKSSGNLNHQECTILPAVCNFIICSQVAEPNYSCKAREIAEHYLAGLPCDWQRISREITKSKLYLDYETLARFLSEP